MAARAEFKLVGLWKVEPSRLAYNMGVNTSTMRIKLKSKVMNITSDVRRGI